MREAADRMIQGLKIAIQTENDGHFFYEMASKLTPDEKGREIFKVLAEEELEHLRFLRKHYDAMLKTDRIDLEAGLGSPMELKGPNPIFSDELSLRIDDAHYEMTALSVGVHLEQNSMNFYRKMADQAPEAEVKAFFENLAEWEQRHYRALLDQQETLKDAYWSNNRFSPM